jgi:DNA polymerase-3 subunit epsilon
MIKKIKNYFYKQRVKDKPTYLELFNNLDNEFISIDCETTGLDTSRDDIISIGAVKIKNNKIVLSEKFDIVVKSSKEMNENSIKIHHIRNCDIQNGLEPEEAIERLIKFLGGSTIIGYFLEFDLAMINRYIKKFANIELPNKTIEVSGLYYDYKIGKIPQGNVDLRFDNIMYDLKLPVLSKHDALSDAIMTALIFIKLKEIK